MGSYRIRGRMIKCPECSCPRIYYDYTCHTYASTRADGSTMFMACLPCDSAIEYVCNDCTWRWNAHLNPRNPRSVENDKKKPDWYVEPEYAEKSYFLRPMPGIVSIYDIPDEWEQYEN